MATVNPYLNFDGNCSEAFDFYKSVFGGDFRFISRFKDMPEGVPMHVDDKDEAELILHVSLPLGGGTVLMGSDRPPSMGAGTIGNNFNISIYTDSDDEARKIFYGLSEGGQVTMPLQKTFWAAQFGMLTDRFGIQWMVGYGQPQEL
jgi:PhnB protein